MEKKYFYDDGDLIQINSTIQSDVLKKERTPGKIVTRFAPSPT